MIIAHERQARYTDIFQAVRGIVFMGTPHRGADVAYWGSTLGKMIKLPLLSIVKTNLLEDLQAKSKVLGEIYSQFVERGKDIGIFTYFERVKTAGLNALASQDLDMLHKH